MKVEISTLGKPELALDASMLTQISQSVNIQGFSGGDASAPCPNCGSTRINLVKMSAPSLHYAAIRCEQCDRFLGWQPKLENQEKRQRRQTTIIHLLKSPQLSQWERTFLEGVKGKKISPKQQEVLARIAAKVGGQG